MAILETERLRLREMEAGDAPFILELLNEPAFIANIRDSGVRDLEGARRYIEEGPRASYAKHGFGLWLTELKATGEPVGICGILKRDTLDHPDLGFAFLAHHHGRGFATEAGGATLAWARARGLHHIVAITAPHNTASAHVLEKLGFRFERLLEPPDQKPTRLYVQGA